MRSGFSKKSCVWSISGIAVCVLIAWAVPLSAVELFMATGLLFVAVVLVPWLVNRSDKMWRQNRNGWRAGRFPSLAAAPRRWWQLSIRATLLVTTVIALLISYLQSNSAVSSFVVGAGCVFGGVVIGFDYEPRGIGILRGKVFSAVCGGVAGAVLFALFSIAVSVAVEQKMPGSWYWISLGRLFLLWSCIGVFAGAALGAWKAEEPFRRQTLDDPFALGGVTVGIDANRRKVTNLVSQPQVRSRGRRQSKVATENVILALLASLLLHATVITLQAGMFDVGTKMKQLESANGTTIELELIPSESESDERESEPVQVALEDDLAVETPDMASAAHEWSVDVSDDETHEQEMVSDDESPKLDVEFAQAAGGTMGAMASTAFEIPLHNQTVVFRSKTNHTWTFSGVSRLKLISDGKRVGVHVDSTGVMSGVELPLSSVSVEFESAESAAASMLAAGPFVRVGTSITSIPLDDHEAKIEIRDSDTWVPDFGLGNRQALPGVQIATRPGSNRSPEQIRQLSAAPGIGGKNLLKNGDFESPRVHHGWTDMEKGGGEFTWVITKERVEMKSGFWNGMSERGVRRNVPVAPPVGFGASPTRPNGDQSIDMDFEAVMHQDFATMPGLMYEVSFWYSHNPDGGNRSASGFVRVRGDRLLLEEKFEHKQASSLDDMKFQQFVGQFRADSRKTRLQFQSLQPSIYGLVIDDVVVATKLLQ